ncbi:hypothetical protein PROFUN_02526 [Planoprotostelium fungivorum]|uniref:CBF1-interacting co-repressor CIR N-terminal domain-containing protein n=1 Tax=Planoprotostelium fungivorum TaxID=1890364 RepID=A0A2P6MPA0_9EUKA|nr:hypothetical protein PROFUN_02526 [Planoprotostelium fungivorum]
MASGAFLNSKSWHPKTFQNQQKVWVAEQEAAKRAKKETERQSVLEKEQKDWRQFVDNEGSGRTDDDVKRAKSMAQLSFMYRPPPSHPDSKEAMMEKAKKDREAEEEKQRMDETSAEQAAIKERRKEKVREREESHKTKFEIFKMAPIAAELSNDKKKTEASTAQLKGRADLNKKLDSLDEMKRLREDPMLALIRDKQKKSGATEARQVPESERGEVMRESDHVHSDAPSELLKNLTYNFKDWQSRNEDHSLLEDDDDGTKEYLNSLSPNSKKKLWKKLERMDKKAKKERKKRRADRGDWETEDMDSSSSSSSDSEVERKKRKRKEKKQKKSSKRSREEPSARVKEEDRGSYRKRIEEKIEGKTEEKIEGKTEETIEEKTEETIEEKTETDEMIEEMTAGEKIEEGTGGRKEEETTAGETMREAETTRGGIIRHKRLYLL